MNAFERIIGYDSIKNELIQICDMIHNKDVYEKLGAKLPQGVLIHGEPGLGKTLMAKCFIEECGLETYTVRRNRGNDDFVGLITDVFEKAKENAPALIFLDDMDKFANEDEAHRNAEEYVAVQSGIDEVKGYEVFVLATANCIRNLPQSLLRSGRFDRKIEVKRPSEAVQRRLFIQLHYRQYLRQHRCSGSDGFLSSHALSFFSKTLAVHDLSNPCCRFHRIYPVPFYSRFSRHRRPDP